MNTLIKFKATFNQLSMINNLKRENVIQKQSDSMGALINGNLSCLKADYQRSTCRQADVNGIYIIKSVSFGKYIVPAAFLSSHSEQMRTRVHQHAPPTNSFPLLFRIASFVDVGSRQPENASLVSRLPGPIPFSGRSITLLKKVGQATPQVSLILVGPIDMILRHLRFRRTYFRSASRRIISLDDRQTNERGALFDEIIVTDVTWI